MWQVARQQPIVKRENSDEEPEPTQPTNSHARGNPRVKQEDFDAEPEPRRVTRSQSASRTLRVKHEESDDEAESSTSNTPQGPRRSPRAKLNKKVGLRLYTEEQSKLANETHHVVVEHSPDYDSDSNMVRDSCLSVKKVDADGKSVATDDSRVQRLYTHDWEVLRDSSGEEDDEDEPALPASRFRTREAPLTGFESWPMEREICAINYYPHIRHNQLDYSLEFPAEITDAIPSEFSHTWLIRRTSFNPRDRFIGHMGRARKYAGACIQLGLASGETIVRNVRTTLPVRPFWGECARCHQLSMVIDPTSRYFCHVGAVTQTKRGRTTLLFRDDVSETYPAKKVAPANEGWWLAMQGSPFMICSIWCISEPHLSRPPIQGLRFDCPHVDGASFIPRGRDAPEEDTTSSSDTTNSSE